MSCYRELHKTSTWRQQGICTALPGCEPQRGVAIGTPTAQAPKPCAIRADACCRVRLAAVIRHKDDRKLSTIDNMSGFTVASSSGFNFMNSGGDSPFVEDFADDGELRTCFEASLCAHSGAVELPVCRQPLAAPFQSAPPLPCLPAIGGYVESPAAPPAPPEAPAADLPRPPSGTLNASSSLEAGRRKVGGPARNPASTPVPTLPLALTTTTCACCTAARGVQAQEASGTCRQESGGGPWQLVPAASRAAGPAASPSALGAARPALLHCVRAAPSPRGSHAALGAAWLSTRGHARPPTCWRPVGAPSLAWQPLKAGRRSPPPPGPGHRRGGGSSSGRGHRSSARAAGGRGAA